VFTRLLIGLDGSPRADQALEQAILLGHRFGATLVVVTVQDPDAADPGLLARAAERVTATGLKVETEARTGEPDLALAELAKGVDAVLVGRRGSHAGEGALGPTVASLIRIAERCVIVCGSAPSPMNVCAVAYDDGETSRRALDLAARFASVGDGTVHLIHAAKTKAAGLKVVGAAEALLSLQGVRFVTHVEIGKPGEVVATVVRRAGADCLFAGAHVPRASERPSVVVSHAEDILRHTDLPVIVQP
jgi:nucleotide-binding universal stress UspA family protein